MIEAEFCTRMGKITAPGVLECHKFNAISSATRREFFAEQDARPGQKMGMESEIAKQAKRK